MVSGQIYRFLVNILTSHLYIYCIFNLISKSGDEDLNQNANLLGVQKTDLLIYLAVNKCHV